MDTIAKEAKNSYMRQYMKEWREKNKDKVKAAQEKYWKKKAEELLKATDN